MSGTPEATQISPRRKALFALLLSSFSVLFGLAAAEVVLRWRANAAADEPEGRAGPKHTQASPHPDVVYELRPGQDGLFREQPLRVNALGLRGPETGSACSLMPDTAASRAAFSRLPRVSCPSPMMRMFRLTPGGNIASAYSMAAA